MKGSGEFRMDSIKVENAGFEERCQARGSGNDAK
jgi:hypothetical protein